MIRQTFHRRVAEKRGVRKRNVVKLRFDRVDDLWMTVPQAGHCSTARSIQVLAPLTVKDVRTLPAYRDWKLGAGVPVKHVRWQAYPYFALVLICHLSIHFVWCKSPPIVWQSGGSYSDPIGPTRVYKSTHASSVQPVILASACK